MPTTVKGQFCSVYQSLNKIGLLPFGCIGTWRQFQNFKSENDKLVSALDVQVHL